MYMLPTIILKALVLKILDEINYSHYYLSIPKSRTVQLRIPKCAKNARLHQVGHYCAKAVLVQRGITEGWRGSKTLQLHYSNREQLLILHGSTGEAGLHPLSKPNCKIPVKPYRRDKLPGAYNFQYPIFFKKPIPEYQIVH